MVRRGLTPVNGQFNGGGAPGRPPEIGADPPL